ncbi:MAG: HlyD family efflux transporter periplasmic adaptor subunit [Acidobacteria bacterium]|nr:HlyD family efflux transporter periplasmic adaptor subunit [Acidobacteriota bacterium]
MTISTLPQISKLRIGARLLMMGVCLISLLSCRRQESATWQGYVEAETLFVSAPIAGTVSQVLVQRGDQVDAQQLLYEMQPAPDDAALVAAQEQLRAAEAELANLKKGLRPDEIREIEAERALAESGIALAKLELQRIDDLVKHDMASQESRDLAQAELTQQNTKYEQASARLATAQLGARSDLVEAGEARVRTARAEIDQIRWRLDNKSQYAPSSAQVQDVLFRVGEFVQPGQPVIHLLAADRIKIRFFVDEPSLQALHQGDTVTVHVDGRPPFTARVGFISTKAEYTPPFIYSKENRQRFVFLVEAWPDDGLDLHPGQPVDVDRVAMP